MRATSIHKALRIWQMLAAALPNTSACFVLVTTPFHGFRQPLEHRFCRYERCSRTRADAAPPTGATLLYERLHRLRNSQVTFRMRTSRHTRPHVVLPAMSRSSSRSLSIDAGNNSDERLHRRTPYEEGIGDGSSYGPTTRAQSCTSSCNLTPRFPNIFSRLMQRITAMKHARARITDAQPEYTHSSAPYSPQPSLRPRHYPPYRQAEQAER